MAHKLNLTAFLKAAELLDPNKDLSAFAAFARRAQVEGEEGFVGPEFELRTIEDWWAEVDAFNTYVALAEEIADDRRRQPTVERRARLRVVARKGR